MLGTCFLSSCEILENYGIDLTDFAPAAGAPGDFRTGLYVGSCENQTVRKHAKMQLRLNRIEGNNVHGSLSINGGGLHGGGNFVGTIRGNTITFKTRASSVLTWSGQLSPSGIDGRYTVTNSNGRIYQRGVWTVSPTTR